MHNCVLFIYMCKLEFAHTPPASAFTFLSDEHRQICVQLLNVTHSAQRKFKVLLEENWPRVTNTVSANPVKDTVLGGVPYS